jgi:hypothetical protein
MNTFRHAAVMPEINTKINQSLFVKAVPADFEYLFDKFTLS